MKESLSLESGENLVAVYRRHGGTAFLRILPIAFFLVILFLFLFPLFSLGTPGVAVFSLLLFFSLFFSLRIIFSWLGTITIVTSRRLLIVQRSGFFKKTVTEIQYDQISQMSYQMKGIPQMIGKYGNLELLVTFTSANISIPDIPDPQEALNTISQVMSMAKKIPSGDAEGNTEQKKQTPAFAKHSARMPVRDEEKSDPANWR